MLSLHRDSERTNGDLLQTIRNTCYAGISVTVCNRGGHPDTFVLRLVSPFKKRGDKRKVTRFGIFVEGMPGAGEARGRETACDVGSQCVVPRVVSAVWPKIVLWSVQAAKVIPDSSGISGMERIATCDTSAAVSPRHEEPERSTTSSVVGEHGSRRQERL